MATPKWLQAMDPSDSKSALGGVTRGVLSSVPGGKAALGAIDAAAGAKAQTDRSKATDRAAAGSSSGATTTAAGPMAWLKKPAVIIGGGVLLLAGVFFLLRPKR
jgi:hypothetical protein